MSCYLRWPLHYITLSLHHSTFGFRESVFKRHTAIVMYASRVPSLQSNKTSVKLGVHKAVTLQLALGLQPEAFLKSLDLLYSRCLVDRDTSRAEFRSDSMHLALLAVGPSRHALSIASPLCICRCSPEGRDVNSHLRCVVETAVSFLVDELQRYT